MATVLVQSECLTAYSTKIIVLAQKSKGTISFAFHYPCKDYWNNFMQISNLFNAYLPQVD